MPKVFISYRRSDSESITGRIAADLRREFGDASIFKDVESIFPSMDFRGAIREGVGQCDVMLVVVGKTWLSCTERDEATGKEIRRLDNPDDWVRFEIVTGLQRHGLLVIPLLVEGAAMPAADDLPDELYEFGYRNAKPLRNDPDYNVDLGRLVQWLRDIDEGNVGVYRDSQHAMQPSAQTTRAQEEHALAASRRLSKLDTDEQERVIGDIPYIYDTGNPFVDRVREQAAIGEAIARHRRLILISGRGGVGKTGLASKVLGDLRYATDRIDGVVVQRAGTILRDVSIDNILTDFERLLPDAGLLPIDPKMSDTQKVIKLLRATHQGRYVLLLDNLESMQDDQTHAINQPDIQALVNLVLEHGGLTLIVTTRLPLKLNNLQMAEVDHHPLSDGLPEADAIAFMRQRPGGKYLPQEDAPLKELIARTRGFPRALQAAVGYVANQQNPQSMQTLLNNAPKLQEEVTGYIVEQATTDLPPVLRRVMEGLSIFERDVDLAALEYVLAPFLDMSKQSLQEMLLLLRRTDYVTHNRLTGRYSLHPIDREYNYSQITVGSKHDLPGDNPVQELRQLLNSGDDKQRLGDQSRYTVYALNYRAAEWFKQQRLTVVAPKSYDDLLPHLREFEYRCRLEDFDNAARILTEIDNRYLLLWGKAHQVLEMHLQIQGKIKSNRLLQRSIGNLGNAYWVLSDVPAAIRCYEQALEYARGAGNQQSTGVWLSALGNSYRSLGKPNKALELYQEALDIAHEIGDRRNEGIRLGNIGLIYLDSGKFEQALEYHQHALAIRRETTSSYTERRAVSVSLSSIGVAYQSLGQVLEAISYHQQALEISREIGDRPGEANRLSNLGAAHSDLGDFDRAMEYYQQSLAISRDIGDRRVEGNQLNNLGVVYRALGEINKALEYCQLALELSQQIADRRNEANRIGTLGRILAEYADFSSAIQYLYQGIDIARETEALPIEQAKQIQLLAVHLMQHNFTKAKTSGLAAAQINVPIPSGNLDALYGLALILTDDRRGARKRFEQALIKAHTVLSKSDRHVEARYTLGLATAGLFVIGENDISAVESIYRQARANCDAAGKLKTQARWVSLLAELPGGEALQTVADMLQP